MSFSRFDHQCMAEALRLAERGLTSCHPNPRVGCVIARQGEVVGRGWHQRAGCEHAEVLALAEAGAAARGSTAYVTLEPCSHQGRTGPCTTALIEAGVAEVVAASADPNPLVDGQGFAQLASAGIRVRRGLMDAAAQALNAGFFTRARQGRPWVRIKTAQSLDGRTALRNGVSQWISSAESRRDVQHWRARAAAVMTGIGTLLKDDPSLTVREVDVPAQPLRVIVDSRWRTPPGARTLGLPGDVLIAGRADVAVPEALQATAAECLALPASGDQVNLAALLSALAEREVNEVQVEAGPALAGALLAAGLVDEILLYLAPSVLGDSARGVFSIGSLERMDQRVRLEWLDSDRVGPDLRLRLRPRQGAA
jgi:diaminohydroxyphosphoribosylaminopyrimidine deaminase/5-amino-6-(5-phosphoribosylamino)uracil reductase